MDRNDNNLITKLWTKKRTEKKYNLVNRGLV